MNQLTKNVLLVASGIAIGAALPIIIPAVIEGGRPLAKALAKHGTINLGKLRVLAAKAAESLEDFVAEVRSEVDELETAAPVAVAHAAQTVEATMHDKKVLS
jgi:hypothetical protein